MCAMWYAIGSDHSDKGTCIVGVIKNLETRQMSCLLYC